MRRFVNVAGATVTAVGIAILLTSQISAQERVSRTPWGHPDLQGLWNVGTMTPVERPASAKGRLTMTVDEARALEKQQAAARAKLAQPSDGNRQAPPVGGDGIGGPLWQRRRLQLFLDRSGRDAEQGRRPAAHVDGG